ncbi:MAG: hypothetical protein QM652_09845 [Legionella sp.]|uniref:hypothetical protein n=1 Tax=Legionella sp. TaxID=459 RepID=UPI0039E4565A
MAYTLTLLGTDTKFSPTHVPNAYDKAETLSYVSSLITGSSVPDLSTDDVVEYRNSNITVVNGPTTLGSEIGDRIAYGVLSVLDAISRGETHINIIAHSRGAVEALLVAHEIERIQTLLSNPGYSFEELLNSVCGYTKSAMNGLHKDAFAKLNLQAIANNINDVRISILNIDPVPGGNYLGITHASNLAWKDPRFFKVPEIVIEYKQYTYENERTRCFKSIVPDSLDGTEFKFLPLPGHHGTGSGNLLDQQRKAALPQGKTTEHVQELLIIKIIDFLTQNGVRITPRAEGQEDPFAHLIQKLFTKVNGNIQFKKEKLPSLYLAVYNAIIENIEAYRFFNKTSYAVLGQENGILKWLIPNITDDRIIHFQAHNNTYLRTIIPPIPGGHFVNYEHARLNLNNELHLQDDMPLSSTIERAIERLIELCDNDIQLKEAQSSPKQQVKMSQKCQQDKLAPALDTKEGFTIFMEGLGLLVEKVKESYLHGKLLTDSEERSKVYDAVKKCFVHFNNYIFQCPDNKLAKTILETLNVNIEKTIQLKYEALTNHYKMLSQKLTHNAYLIELQENIDKLLSSLGAMNEDNIRNSLINELNNFMRAIANLAQNNSSSGNARELLNATLAQLQAAFPKEVLEQEDAKKYQRIVEDARVSMRHALENSQEYDLENLMQEVLISYNDLEEFSTALPDFKVLYSKPDYDKLSQELKSKCLHIVLLAAKYITENQISLDKVIQPFFRGHQALYEQIAGFAISFGAENPLKVELEVVNKQIIELKTEVSHLNKKGNDLKELLKVQEQAVTQFREQNEGLNQQNANLKQNKEKLAAAFYDETEYHCLQALNETLIPKTKEYLEHLISEVIKSVIPDYKVTGMELALRHLESITWPQDKTIETLQQKFILVKDMYIHLINKEDQLLPSEKVVHFYNRLDTSQDLLERHRDSKTQRYLINALSVFVILATGILPGLFVLAIASKVRGESMNIDFWSTSGHRFFQASKDVGIEVKNFAPKAGIPAA